MKRGTRVRRRRSYIRGRYQRGASGSEAVTEVSPLKNYFRELQDRGKDPEEKFLFKTVWVSCIVSGICKGLDSSERLKNPLGRIMGINGLDMQDADAVYTNYANYMVGYQGIFSVNNILGLYDLTRHKTKINHLISLSQWYAMEILKHSNGGHNDLLDKLLLLIPYKFFSTAYQDHTNVPVYQSDMDAHDPINMLLEFIEGLGLPHSLTSEESVKEFIQQKKSKARGATAADDSSRGHCEKLPEFAVKTRGVDPEVDRFIQDIYTCLKLIPYSVLEPGGKAQVTDVQRFRDKKQSLEEQKDSITEKANPHQMRLLSQAWTMLEELNSMLSIPGKVESSTHPGKM